MSARFKVTDAMVDAAMNAVLQNLKRTGRAPHDATHADFDDYDAACQAMREGLQAAAGVHFASRGEGAE